MQYVNLYLMGYFILEWNLASLFVIKYVLLE